MRNPVAKHSNKVNKPATHRNKKKDYRRKDRYPNEELHRPAHSPYEREHRNWTHSIMVDGLGDEE
jgi:hypothetical protein